MIPQKTEEKKEIPGIVADFEEMAKTQELAQGIKRQLDSDNLTSLKLLLKTLKKAIREVITKRKG